MNTKLMATLIELDALSASVFGAKNAEALKIMDRGGWK